MADKKFDGVIEAVHYTRKGQIDFVRAYERRGASFSDRVLLDRKTLLERLRARKRFVTGERRRFLASTFDSGRDVNLVTSDGREFVSTRTDATEDTLEGVPVI
ncbi:MAG: hypothetical protein Q7T89_01790 [Anaerolineales bacterium]|nr:hypothetical protein [Anaerolineales bacterium]